MLYEYLKKFTLEDALKIESQDRQFLALKRLYESKKFSNELYLFLIIANALISFQLSWKGEDYREEFSEEVGRNFWRNRKKKDIYEFFENLLKNGKNNRRFIDLKLKRIQKILDGFEDRIEMGKFEKYYKNMDRLAEDLAEIMRQAKDAKTIVFAVKMFSYGARNVFGYVERFPFSLNIPIDSRLEKLYLAEVGRNFWRSLKKKEISGFYQNLAKKLNIPPLHLDAILWVNFDKIEKMLNVRDV